MLQPLVKDRVARMRSDTRWGKKQEAMKKHIQELLDKMFPESLYFMSKQADLVYCIQMKKESVNLLDD